jgi:hypothetical protein
MPRLDPEFYPEDRRRELFPHLSPPKQKPNPSEVKPPTVAAVAVQPSVVKAVEHATDHLIDCDATLLIPDGWTVVEHRKGGQWKWDPREVQLHLATRQQQGKVIQGRDLRKELKDKPVFSVNVLNYLRAHPELIPDDWKGKAVFFWGTIYRDRGGDLYVRYLYWDGDRWGWDCHWLDYGWSSDDPAAVRASPA